MTSDTEARYDANTWTMEAAVQGSLELGWAQVEPSLGFRLVTTQQPEFTETGEHGLRAPGAAHRPQDVEVAGAGEDRPRACATAPMGRGCCAWAMQWNCTSTATPKNG